jgi:hypothetical protein
MGDRPLSFLLGEERELKSRVRPFREACSQRADSNSLTTKAALLFQ